MKEILHDSIIYYFKIHMYFLYMYYFKIHKRYQGKSSKENGLNSKYTQVDIW